MKAILAVVVLAMAAFAGIMIVGDDADADSTSITVTYSLGGSQIVKTVGADGNFTFQSASDILPGYEPAEGKEFKGWQVVGSTTIYQVGVPYAFTASVEVAPYEVFITASITLVYGDVQLKISADDADSGIDNAAVLTKIAGDEGFAKKAGLTYVAGTADSDPTLTLAGYEFKGFLKAGEIQIVDITDVSVDAHKTVVFTAVFDKVFTVTFVANGMTIGTCYSNDFKQIEDPSIPNYKFLGWNVDGVRVSEVVAGKITIPATYKIEKDTQFDAVFEPIQLTITLVVGEYSTTQPALYGQKITAPALPDGYNAWCVKDKEGNLVEFDFTQSVIESDMTFYAQKAPEVYSVTFMVGSEQVAYFADNTKKITIPDIIVPPEKKFIGWFVGTEKILDPVAYAAEQKTNVIFVASFTEADAPAGPGFFETTTGQCVAVIIAVVIIALAYAVATNMFGLKDALTSVKITRVKK